ncbi:hypothetical protein IIA16_05040, partial [bacterium]|nr:hypothetical protein [bacterium]
SSPVIGTAPSAGSIVVGSGDDTLPMSVTASDPDGDTLRYWWFVDTVSGLPEPPDCVGATANWDFVPSASGMSGDAAEVVAPAFAATAALVDPLGSGTCEVPVRVAVGDQKASGIVEQGGGPSATTLEDAEGSFSALGICDIDTMAPIRPECPFGWFVWNISEAPAEYAQIKTVVSDTELLLDGAGILSLMDAGESFWIIGCDLGGLATPGDPTDDCQEAPATPATVSVTLAPPPSNSPPNITTSPTMTPASVVETTSAAISVIAEDVDGPLPLAYWWHAFLTADGTEAPKGTFADPTLNATTWTAPAVTIPTPAGAHTLRIDVANVQVAGIADQVALGPDPAILRDTAMDFVALGVLPGWTVRRWDGAAWAFGSIDKVGLAGGCFFDGSTLCLVSPLVDEMGVAGPVFSAGDTYEIFSCDLGDKATPGSLLDICTVTTDPGQSASVGFSLVENLPPLADLAFSVLDNDPFNLLIQLDATQSNDPDNRPNPSLSYAWDFDYRDDIAAGGNGDLTLDAADFNSDRITSTGVTNITFTANLPSYQVAVKVSDGLIADDAIDFVLILPNQGPEISIFWAYDQSAQTAGADESGNVLGPPLPVTPTGTTVGFSITICDDDALDIVEFDFDYDGVAFTVDSVEAAGGIATPVAGTGDFPGNGCDTTLLLYTWEANSAATDGLDGQGLAFPFAGDYRIAARVTDAEGARSQPFCLDTDPANPLNLVAVSCPEGTPKTATEAPVTVGVDSLVSDFTPPDGNAGALSPGQHDLESPDGILFHMVWTDDRACLGAGMPQIPQIYYSRNTDVGLDPTAWSASKNISDGDTLSCAGNSKSPDLVIDPADPTHLIVFFADDQMGDFDIWWVQSFDSGLTWGAFATPVPATVRAGGPGNQVRPALSIDSTGGPYAGFWHLHFEDSVTGTGRQVHALYEPLTATWGLPDARIDSPPQALVTIDGETVGPAPFTPTLYAAGHPSLGPEFDSYDPEGGLLTYEWDWDWSPLGDCLADPFADAVGASTTPSYTDVGFHYLGLRATDDKGNIDCAGIWLTSNMGNMPPEPIFRLCQPGTGGSGEPECVSLGQ